MRIWGARERFKSWINDGNDRRVNQAHKPEGNNSTKFNYIAQKN